MPKLQVEVIPWFHDSRVLLHEEIIDYIRRLPKNSPVALEISQHSLDAAYKVFDLIASRKIRKIRPDTLAALEIIHECEKRNMRIIPLETFTTYEAPFKKNKYRLSKNDYKNYCADIIREKTFVQEILRASKKLHGKIYAIVGDFHAEELVRALQSKGIPSKINIEIFSEKEGLFSELSAARRARAMFETKKIKEAQTIFRETREIEARDRPLDIGVLLLARGIVRRNNMQKIRWKAKSALANKRMSLRKPK